ncbi:MAG: hypothetical protein ACTSPS_14670 [Promethearchaeota archaeon]|nr:hypothetical protein [Deltaproteobacteria bacterium]
MLNVQTESSYDAEKNISFIKFIDKPLTFEDIDYMADQQKQVILKGGKNKVWVISDISLMGMASPRLVTYYQKLLKPLRDKYVIDFCVICGKTMERIAAQLFNILMREKSPIFSTMDEALDWTIKEQETRGRFIPVE